MQHFAAIDPRSTPLAKQALKVGTLFAFIYNAEQKHIYGRSERKRKEKEHVSLFYNIIFVSEHIQHALRSSIPVGAKSASARMFDFTCVCSGAPLVVQRINACGPSSGSHAAEV